MLIGLQRKGHNYYGDGSDGAATISSNTNLTSTTDGDFVIKQYTSLTINSGVTLSVSNRCKGLIIYVQDACNIQGSLSMTGKGANLAAFADGLLRKVFLDATGSRGLPTEFFTAAAGGAGGAGISSGSTGNAGGTATNGTGGGGGGGRADGSSVSGAGSAGTCFSGGAGGGGACRGATAGDAGVNGGAGGAGAGTGAGADAAGGAGNPAGLNAHGNPGATGSNGTGGFILLVVGGNLTLGASGSVQANGMPGDSGRAGGGGSGGGRIGIYYAGTLSDSGSKTATGGAGGSGGPGGAGGAGSITGPTKIAAK